MSFHIASKEQTAIKSEKVKSSKADKPVLNAPVPDTAQKTTDFSLDGTKPLTTTQMTEDGKFVVTLQV